MYNTFVPKIEYKIIRNKKLTGNISLGIKNGEVIVRAPFWVPKNIIDNFVVSKNNWIKKALEKTSPPLHTKNYSHGEEHLLFGQNYQLDIELVETPVRTVVSKDNTRLNVKIYKHFDETKKTQEIKDALLRFYLEVGIGYITDKVNYYTKELGVEYSKIDIKKVSSIWGSCSGKNVLSFNRKLVMAPNEITDYVIIHEVCHLRERNHSSRFWGLVFKYDRYYKEHRRWLFKNSSLLTI